MHLLISAIISGSVWKCTGKKSKQIGQHTVGKMQTNLTALQLGVSGIRSHAGILKIFFYFCQLSGPEKNRKRAELDARYMLEVCVIPWKVL